MGGGPAARRLPAHGGEAARFLGLDALQLLLAQQAAVDLLLRVIERRVFQRVGHGGNLPIT